MILTENQVKLYKEYSDFTRVPKKTVSMIESLFDTIEALQQENAKMKQRLEDVLNRSKMRQEKY